MATSTLTSNTKRSHQKRLTSTQRKLAPRYFQQRIMAWFDAHGRKSLPWQENKSAYRVWISEIMLQQTQVGTVIPYYHAFMARFPDIQSLATAEIDSVLHHWSGLGYYQRARNLHKAAIIVMSQFNGVFPSDVNTIQTLPGIGRSTAGAISALAFKHRTPILDGNVKRVLCRFFGIGDSIKQRETEETLWALADRYTPLHRVDDYTQAMMDLGATCCTRTKPRCDQCPLQSHCFAFLHQAQHSLPSKIAKKALPKKSVTFLVIEHREKILLIKRPAKGIWAGLYAFPELSEHTDTKDISAYCKTALTSSIASQRALPPIKHLFSHYELTIKPIHLRLKHYKGDEKSSHFWYTHERTQNIGLPKPVSDILRSIK